MKIATAPDGPGYPAKLPDLLFFICFYLLYRILSLIRVEVNHVGFALTEMPSGISFRISPRAARRFFQSSVTTGPFLPTRFRTRSRVLHPCEAWVPACGFPFLRVYPTSEDPHLKTRVLRDEGKKQRLRISGCAVFKVEMTLKQSSGNFDSAILITANLITANLITARVCLLSARFL